MLIVCPRCETTFTLSDELFKQGKKARCSNCGLVFPMTAPESEPGAPAAKREAFSQENSRAQGRSVLRSTFRKPLLAAAAVFLLLLLSYGTWLIVSSFSGSSGHESAVTADKRESGAADEDHARLIRSVTLDDVLQFLVDNTEAGKIMVIQGMAKNISETPKDFIAVEGRILDGEGRVLGEPVQQLCGVALTLFQLESLSTEEIHSTLNNRVTILTYNTNVPPGGRVPFVLVFPSPPADMKKFEVRVINVQEAGS